MILVIVYFFLKFQFCLILYIPADTRSPIPVISVHSVGNLQYCGKFNISFLNSLRSTDISALCERFYLGRPPQ